MTTQQLEEKQVLWRWYPTEEEQENLGFYRGYALISEPVGHTPWHKSYPMVLAKEHDVWYLAQGGVQYSHIVWKLMQEREQMQEELKWLRFGLQLRVAPNEVGKSDALPVVLTQEEAQRIAFALQHGTDYAWELHNEKHALAMTNAVSELQTAIERAK